MKVEITAEDFGLPEYESDDEKIEPYVLLDSGGWATYASGNITSSSSTIWYYIGTL